MVPSEKNEHLKDGELNEKQKTSNPPADSGGTEPSIESTDSTKDTVQPVTEKSSKGSASNEKEHEAAAETKAKVVDESADQETKDTHGQEKAEKVEPKPKEEEKVNFALLSKEDLVKLFDEFLRNKSYQEIRSEVDEIQTAYQEKHEEEIKEKKEKFLAEGGLEQDFKPVEDPFDKQMEDLSEKFKSLKADHNKQLEQEKDENLKKKQELLEEFRLLMEGQEGFDSTFRKFKQLQKKWFDVGIVPRQNVKDLWNSYNYFVDKFNDYVKINRELREIDLKKNLDLKVKLCEKVEALADEKNISTAFKTLQKYHAQWREIGPVPREDKDSLWERFKAATSVINRAHQKSQSELKESLQENLEKKRILCEKAEAIAVLEPEKHNDWVDQTNTLLALQKEWKTIGYAPKKDNNQIYSRFRSACDKFFEKKAAFYADTYAHQKENLELKKAIIEEANALKDDTDWKNTTDKLIELQKRWKDIGPVPRRESDRIWKQFRTACDTFFNNKSAHFRGKDESFEENLKAKEDLIKELEEYVPTEEVPEVTEKIKDFQDRFNEIGFVPVEAKDRIRKEFQAAQKEVIEKLPVDESRKILISYKLKILSLLQNPRGEGKLRFEHDKLTNKLQQLKNDIGVWENNIGFFKETKSSEGTISEFQEKIEDAHKRIDILEKKIRIINDLEDNM